jgi:hypothetical protein
MRAREKKIELGGGERRKKLKKWKKKAKDDREREMGGREGGREGGRGGGRDRSSSYIEVRVQIREEDAPLTVAATGTRRRCAF